jgi:hypothetical protein
MRNDNAAHGAALSFSGDGCGNLPHSKFEPVGRGFSEARF